MRFKYIYQNELDKVYFQHDLAKGDSNDLPRRKVLKKHYVIKHLIWLKI